MGNFDVAIDGGTDLKDAKTSKQNEVIFKNIIDEIRNAILSMLWLCETRRPNKALYKIF